MNELNKKGAMALSQVFILVMGIFAFGFIVGEIGRVEGAEPTFLSQIFGFDEGYKTALANPGKQIDATLLNQGDFLDGLVSTAAWALIAYGVVQMVGGLFGLEEEQQSALSLSAAAGFGVGRGAYLLAQKGSWGTNWATSGEGLGKIFGQNAARNFGITSGIVVAAIVFFLTYKDTEEKTYEYTCEPWQAPVGGSKCEECNKQGILPCSEYQCRSLGQACKLVNPGSTEEKCVWVNPKDVNPPVMEPWLAALLEGYKYTPDNAISPPDRGVIIQNNNATNRCVTAFTPMTFGISLDEPAKCKIDYLRKEKFDDMEFWFGGSQLLRYNHTQIMSLPGKAAYDAENIEINNYGNYEVYVRCQDENGNFNTGNFVFKFCVDEGPDTTAPVIVTTNLINGMPIAHNQSSIELIVYTNEPADCSWGKLDEEYEDLDNKMTCSRSVTEMNAQMLYKCATTLTGLKNAEENKFYFRCKDQPIGVNDADRNINSESYVFTLGGTIPLVIGSVGPNETIRDNTDPVKVILTADTNAGAEEGKALCSYKESGSAESAYVQFYSTASHKHSQDLFLSEGSYSYDIKCVDLGGNSATKTTSFYVESDSEAPTVVRAYKEENNLKLITDEEAECVYDILNCNYLFTDGISFTTLEGNDHFTEWNTLKNFYVKCKDEYGNEPAPDKCSIIVKPFEIYSAK